MRISIRAQWWAVGLGTLGLTLASVQCTPAQQQRLSPVRYEPVQLSDGLVDVREDGGAPMRRGIPRQPSEGQKKPPCDAEMGEEAHWGACYIPVAGRKPPCGRLLEDGNQCFRAIFKAPRQPATLER